MSQSYSKRVTCTRCGNRVPVSETRLQQTTKSVNRLCNTCYAEVTKK